MRPVIFAPMRKWALLVIACLLLGRTELHQLIRLPHLVHHFFDHQAEQPDLSLVDFLVMHYLSGDVEDADFAQDERLPFRSHDDLFAHSVTLDLFVVPEVLPLLDGTAIELKPTYAPPAVNAGSLCEVWQPPKRA